MNPQHETTSLLGSEVHYLVSGPDDGPAIVLIHGFRGTHHGLAEISANLPTNYRQITPDLPGFGDSTPMTDHPHTIEGYAEFITALVQKLDLSAVTLIGHSMGTLIAAETAARLGLTTNRLILVNPIAKHPLRGLSALKNAPAHGFFWLASDQLPEKLGRQMLNSRWSLLLASVIMAKTRDKNLRRRIHQNHLTYMNRFANLQVLRQSYHSSLRGLLDRDMSQLAAPTLIIAGQTDNIAPIATQRRLAAILPNATLIELPNVGHLVHYEQPREAATAISEFLSGQAPAGSATAASLE